MRHIYSNSDLINKIENIEEKKIFIEKSHLLYCVLDQFINITFSEEKPQILPDSVIDKMLNELKIKDLGSLKEKIKITKNRLNRYRMKFYNCNKYQFLVNLNIDE